MNKPTKKPIREHRSRPSTQIQPIKLKQQLRRDRMAYYIGNIYIVLVAFVIIAILALLHYYAWLWIMAPLEGVIRAIYMGTYLEWAISLTMLTALILAGVGYYGYLHVYDWAKEWFS